MKILFFTYDFPYPTTSGGKNRAYHLLKYGREGIQFFLFSFTRPDFNEDDIKELNKIGVEKIKIFKRKKLRKLSNILYSVNPFSSIFKRLYFEKKIFDSLIQFVKDEQIDIIHFESYYTSFYLSEELNKLGVKQVFGSENIEQKIYFDYAFHLAKLPLKPFYFYEVAKIKREEDALFRKADACFAVTEAEANLINKVTGKKCYVIENGLDVKSFSFKIKKPKDKKVILFVGNFTYFPNIAAARFFYNEVFKEIPGDVTFRIIGKNSTKLAFASDPNVEVVEFVEDIKKEYYNADVFVSPVKFGGGTNFKILEAMALGTPVVAFAERTDEFGIKDGVDIMLANDKITFKEKTTKLLKDAELSKSMSANARKIVEEKFSWNIIGKKANKAWKEI